MWLIVAFYSGVISTPRRVMTVSAVRGPLRSGMIRPLSYICEPACMTVGVPGESSI